MFRRKLFVFVLICITVFLSFYYILQSFGNNKTINQDMIANKILKRFKNYEAKINVCVISNKNENYYMMEQFVDEYSSKLIISSPENVKGIVIENSNGDLKILNSVLNMEKVYDNYGILLTNSLYLNTFLEDSLKYGFTFKENSEEIIINIDINDSTNTYAEEKELHLDRNYMPKSLIIKDNTNRARIRILYTDMKIK